MYWKVGPAKDWESAMLLLRVELQVQCRSREPKHLLVPIFLTRPGSNYYDLEEKWLA